MTTKQYNHRNRIKKAARHGVNEIIANKVRYGSDAAIAQAKIVSELSDSICTEVVEAILEQFTIRNRNRK